MNNIIQFPVKQLPKLDPEQDRILATKEAFKEAWFLLFFPVIGWFFLAWILIEMRYGKEL